MRCCLERLTLAFTTSESHSLREVPICNPLSGHNTQSPIYLVLLIPSPRTFFLLIFHILTKQFTNTHTFHIQLACHCPLPLNWLLLNCDDVHIIGSSDRPSSKWPLAKAWHTEHHSCNLRRAWCFYINAQSWEVSTFQTWDKTNIVRSADPYSCDAKSYFPKSRTTMTSFERTTRQMRVQHFGGGNISGVTQISRLPACSQRITNKIKPYFLVDLKNFSS